MCYIERLTVFSVKVLRKIYFGWQSEEVTGDWMKLQNDELHDSYSSPE